MNKSEELVFRLCAKSFLSLWSYPSPRGKDSGKELCDILVVCDPNVIIFSVKEINFKGSDKTSIDWERWRKKAIDDSCKQIYGAERWINSAKNVITREGKTALPFPEVSHQHIYRVAVALGGKGKTPLYFGDFGKGFVHVFDEVSLDIVMQELDTITDFIKYLEDKEQLYYRGVQTLFGSGGEEDLLAFYLHNGRRFPDEPDLIVFDGDLWRAFVAKQEYQAKKQADRISYVWDRLIETISEDYRSERLLSEHSFSVTQLSDVELAVRAMACEDRFSRRLLGSKFIEFLELTQTRNVRSRVVPASSGVNYVFLVHPHGGDREYRMAELAARCFVVRGLKPESELAVGIATEEYEPNRGFSLDVLYLRKPSWTEEDQKHLEYLQKEFGYFSNPVQTHLNEDEYPTL